MTSVLLRLLILITALGAAILLNLCLGDVSLSPDQVVQFLVGHGNQAAQSGMSEVLWQIRIPRLLIAAIVGASLAVSGYVLQCLSRNSLADPYLTGVSSGSGLAVACAMTLGADFAIIPGAAFVGGLAASILVALMSRTANGISVARLLLSGVGISAICGAFITLILIHGSQSAQAQGIFFWLAGGIAGRTWTEVIPAAVYASTGLVITLIMSKTIRLLSLGPQMAQSLGLNVQKAQITLLAIAVMMCGAAVSVSGLVGFVGLIAPHLARMLFDKDERVQIIASALLGMTLVLISDLAARTLGQGQEMPLGTLLSLIGGPFFLWLVATQNRHVVES